MALRASVPILVAKCVKGLVVETKGFISTTAVTIHVQEAAPPTVLKIAAAVLTISYIFGHIWDYIDSHCICSDYLLFQNKAIFSFLPLFDFVTRATVVAQASVVRPSSIFRPLIQVSQKHPYGSRPNFIRNYPSVISPDRFHFFFQNFLFSIFFYIFLFVFVNMGP